MKRAGIKGPLGRSIGCGEQVSQMDGRKPVRMAAHPGQGGCAIVFRGKCEGHGGVQFNQDIMPKSLRCPGDWQSMPVFETADHIGSGKPALYDQAISTRLSRRL
jgi:hypothetical protein